MNGKHLAIGLVLFTILACIAVYFVFQATIVKDQNGMEQIVMAFEHVDNHFIQ